MRGYYKYIPKEFGPSIEDIILTYARYSAINWNIMDEILKYLKLDIVYEDDTEYVLFSNKFCKIYTFNMSLRDDYYLLHKENGPAVILENGTRIWYNMGRLHREDGPAKIEGDLPDTTLINNATGYEYWIYGEQIRDKNEFKNIRRTYLIDKMTQLIKL